jgi:hypothetical protein
MHSNPMTMNKEYPVLRFPWMSSPAPLPATRGWRPLGRAVALGAAACALALLTGCVGTTAKKFSVQEDFGSVTTYSRLFDATPVETCEASRRALLSQGYVISSSAKEMVEGSKNFQPEPESHLQMVVRVVCVPEADNGKVSLGFVTATQDTFSLRKTNNSASLGVGAIGSVSLPFSSTSESLVKVGSETIAKAAFYENFFDLVKRYLVLDKTAED